VVLYFDGIKSVGVSCIFQLLILDDMHSLIKSFTTCIYFFFYFTSIDLFSCISLFIFNSFTWHVY